MDGDVDELDVSEEGEQLNVDDEYLGESDHSHVLGSRATDGRSCTSESFLSPGERCRVN